MHRGHGGSLKSPGIFQGYRELVSDLLDHRSHLRSSGGQDLSSIISNRIEGWSASVSADLEIAAASGLKWTTKAKNRLVVVRTHST